MYEVGLEREYEKTKNDEARMKESNLTHFIVVDGGAGCIQGRLYYKVFAEKGVKYPETYLQLTLHNVIWQKFIFFCAICFIKIFTICIAMMTSMMMVVIDQDCWLTQPIGQTTQLGPPTPNLSIINIFIHFPCLCICWMKNTHDC